MTVPCKEKYIDEVVGVWSIFGSSGNGVDVNDGIKDVFTNLPPEVAVEICKIQEEFRNKLYACMCRGIK